MSSGSQEHRAKIGLLPLLPLRSLALFPGVARPIDLGRAASVNAVRKADERRRGGPRTRLIVVATQREPMIERPDIDDLHPVGVLGELVQVLHGVPGRVTSIVRGLERVHLLDVEQGREYLQARFQRAHETSGDPTLAHALAGALRDLLKQHDGLLPANAKTRARAEILNAILAERSPGRVADMCASHVELDHGERVSILQELHVTERLRKVIELVSHRTNVLQVKRDLDQHVREHLSRHEHEAVLRHRLRAIQSELGESEDDERWIDNLEERLRQAELPEHAAKVANHELERLRRMNPQGNEAMIVRTYLEWLADLPWSESRATPDRHDIAATRQLLEDEHYGIQKVKKRVLEYLSVRKLAPDKRGPILCLSGPPGVGKTSLGRSIAQALGREFVRASLGGVRDDAEIRGHRRTYIGALPGRIIQGMKRAGTINPVFVLDEIDKLVAPDLRGDPAGALLEALDPETNHSFEDHYLATGYDLSRVIFICTGNDASAIPGVLRDRFELIELNGYTVEEKVAIARDYLLPRERKAHGLAHVDVRFPDEILLELATVYTRESGVRNLQREIAAVLRDVAMGIAEGKAPSDEITSGDLLRILGPPRYHEELKEKDPAVGVVTGLGWTPTGGRLLFVEVSMTQGDGNLRLTGRLGEVMKESGQTALSFVRSETEKLGIDRDFLKARDLHLHVPAGAVPKDGPSAGITAATAIISILTGRPARPDIAMTGEITLRGRVLPVGGVREKVLAAHRAGIRSVILPDRNRKDEPDLPERCREEMTLHYVRTIHDVLELALLDPSAENAAE